MKTKTITPLFVKTALGLDIDLGSDAEIPFSDITIDSRRTKSGSFFIAMKGDKFDGHDFIQDAINNRARAILCQKEVAKKLNLKSPYFFGVDDPLESYRALAAAWRKEFNIPIVAVTGSYGKTTTKELIASILQGKWKNILKTEASQNGFVGIPLTLLELNSSHQAAVIEIGIDEIGSMQKHLEVVHPTASVLTSIGPEHLENLIDVDTVAREEFLSLSFVANEGGWVVINLDDAKIHALFGSLTTDNKLFYSVDGNSASARDKLISGTIAPSGTQILFKGYRLENSTFPLPLLGKHNASNLAGAISIAFALGLNSKQVQAGLSLFKPATGRSEVYDLSNFIRVVCDYYNSQPASLEAGLRLLAQVSPSGIERFACLADMLELGVDEEKYHRQVASILIELKIENILLFGKRMEALQDELQKRGFQGKFHHFNSKPDLIKDLLSRLKPRHCVLIKGSRGTRMEEVWEAMKTNFGFTPPGIK